MTTTASAAANPLAAPPALTDAYNHLLRALKKRKVVTWQIDIPDMCCDEHYNAAYDELRPVEADDFCYTLTSTFVMLAKDAGHLFEEDPIDREAGDAVTQALGNALSGTRYPVGDFEAADLLAWARSAPVTFAELLEQTAHDLLRASDVGVLCDVGAADVHLCVSDRKTKYVRRLTQDEIGALVRLDA